MMIVYRRKFVDPESANIPILIMGWHQVRCEDAGINGAFRVLIDQYIKHIFCTPDLIKPVMDKREFQVCSPIVCAPDDTTNRSEWLFCIPFGFEQNDLLLNIEFAIIVDDFGE